MQKSCVWSPLWSRVCSPYVAPHTSQLRIFVTLAPAVTLAVLHSLLHTAPWLGLACVEAEATWGWLLHQTTRGSNNSIIALLLRLTCVSKKHMHLLPNLFLSFRDLFLHSWNWQCDDNFYIKVSSKVKVRGWGIGRRVKESQLWRFLAPMKSSMWSQSLPHKIPLVLYFYLVKDLFCSFMTASSRVRMHFHRNIKDSFWA